MKIERRRFQSTTQYKTSFPVTRIIQSLFIKNENVVGTEVGGGPRFEELYVIESPNI